MALLQNYKVLFEQNLQIDHIIRGGEVVWPTTVKADPSTIPFYVQNITNSDETVTIKKQSSNNETIDIYKSDDKTHWTLLGTTSTTPLTFTLVPRQRVYLRATTSTWHGGSIINSSNIIIGMSKVGGNIMSLLYGNNFENQTEITTNRALSWVFYQNDTLIDASDLAMPATTLSNSCYAGLFNGCSSLSSGPKILPATTLTSGCYNGMFNGCSSLINIPEIYATTLADSCCMGMFANCTSLTTATDLIADTLVNQCYWNMFQNCTSLNYVKCLATNGFEEPGAGGYFYNMQDWLDNVSSTGIFVKAAGITWPAGKNGIPSGWTVEEV